MNAPLDKNTDKQADPGPAAATKAWSRRLGKPGIAALAVAVVAAAYLLVGGRGSPPPPAFPAPTVTVAKPLVKELVDWKEFTGQFEAADYVEIRARVSGYLKSIHFEDGKLVKKGDLLFVIEPEPYEIALETAKAQLADAIAKQKLAKVQLARTAELRKKSVAAASTYDQRVAELRSAEAAVHIAKAAVSTAKLNLEYTRLTAPVSGRVSRHEISVGNLIVGGTGGAVGSSTLLTTIVTLDPINFIFDVSETDALEYKRSVQLGEVKSARDNLIPAFVQLADETTWARKGTIDFVDNRFDRSSGTIRVRAVAPNPDLFIVPGQFGRIRAPVSQPHMAMLIPDTAIASDQARKIVYAIADDGTATIKVITVGAAAGNGLRIVRGGLAPDDRVVINGLMRVRPGIKVKAEPGKIEAGPAKP